MFRSTFRPNQSLITLQTGFPAQQIVALLSVILGFCMISPAISGQYNEVLNIGSPAPAWVDLPGADGKTHSLADLKDAKAVVFVFTCLSCPTATDYEDRINALTEKYRDKGVAVVAVCVNKVAEDRLPKIVNRATEKKLAFPYLYDESQKIAKDYGAIFTPEFYVLDQSRKIAYMGALDDSTDPASVKIKYVEEALDAVLAGKAPTTTETIARGCRVRYARERR